MDGRKKQSILRRLWRKISGQRVPHNREHEDVTQTILSTSQRPILPVIPHTASLSSSTGSRDELSARLEDEKARRRASMPITQLETLRENYCAEHGYTSRSGSASQNSSAVTMVNVTTKLVDKTPQPCVRHPIKLPPTDRRRTFDMGDTLNRTITMTNGFYDTMHDKGRVKVGIHKPKPESPPLSPHMAGRAPLHLIGTKRKQDPFKRVRKIREAPLLKFKTQKKAFVLESSITSPSPFFSPDPVKLEIARLDYHLHLPDQIEHADVETPETPVPCPVELQKEEPQLVRRIMLEPSGPPPPMSLPPTPLKARLRLDFVSPSSSPSKIPIATKTRYFSFATSP